MDYETAENEINKIIEHSKKLVLQKIVEFLYENFTDYNWVGIYIVQDQNLILGPWAGEQSTEHTIIPIGTGICGSAAKTGETEIVADVKNDTRYLSCFITTKSEIVVPIYKNQKVIGEIDIDSNKPNAFDKEDQIFLENICKKISNFL